jgi:hypothetical protein
MRSDEEIEAIVSKAVIATLSRFGIEEDDHKEFRADMIHVRRWRKSVEQTQTYTFKAIVTVLVSGFIGVVWLGFKTMLGK